MANIVNHHHQYLLKFAKLHCIFDASPTRAALIRAIQQSEGNFGCFGTGSMCERVDLKCGWRGDCLLESTYCPQARAGRIVLTPNTQPAGY